MKMFQVDVYFSVSPNIKSFSDLLGEDLSGDLAYILRPRLFKDGIIGDPNRILASEKQVRDFYLKDVRGALELALMEGYLSRDRVDKLMTAIGQFESYWFLQTFEQCEEVEKKTN